MATLVLTAVGSLVGGPIGGAIGSVLGSSIDRSLFSPRRAIGPRLSGLAVQGSSYGAPIPKLFGTMRVAGTVIWATDLREETHKSGGKGQPRTTSYSYSASFAVALSSRPIRGVRRVWADGNLLRGAGGDWKGELAEFRLHIGGEGQSADPLIASAEGTLPPQWLSIAVGDIVTLPATAGRWRVTARTLEAFAVRIEAVRLPGAGFAPVASAGRATSEPDLAAGATTIALLDLPTIGDRPSDQPTLLVAAAGASAGWRRATVIGSIDGGETWSTIGRTAAGAVLGIALDALPAGAPALIDEVSSVEVELLSDAMMLAGDDRPGWSAERNLILIGDELVQFGAAELLGGCRWRLRRLLRGRRGTEWACADHAAGERVVLVDPDTLLAWPLPAAAIGATVTIAATGAGDAVPATATIRFDGRALKPPAPVHATAQRAPNGDVAIGWTRRSRAGWPWIDGSDAPLAEQAERYRVEISRGAGTAMVETDGPSLAIPAAALAAIGVGPATARIAQTGTFGASRAAIITLPTEPDR